LSLATTTDGSPAPLIFLYGEAPVAAREATLLAQLPGGVEVRVAATARHARLPTITVEDASPGAALRALAKVDDGRDIVLVAWGAELPPHWWTRLQAAARSLPAAGVISALGPAHAALDPFAAGHAGDADARDAQCWAHSEHHVVPVSAWSPTLSLWRPSALAALDAAAGVDLLPFGCEAFALDHLYVGDARVGLREGTRAPALEALAIRLRGLAAERNPPRCGLDGKPVVLHVLHGWGGGAQRFVEDLARADTHRHHLVLRAEGDAGTRSHGDRLALYDELQAPAWRVRPLSAPIATTALHSVEYEAHLRAILVDFGIGAVLVSSLIGHSLDALRSGLPTAVVCHDYYPVWPRLHADFGDAASDFSPVAIDAALARPGAGFGFDEARPTAWRALRAAYIEALEHAAAILVAPSRSVEANLKRIEPALARREWHQVEHGFAGWGTAPVPIETDPARKRLRIVVPGRIRAGKGEDLIAALLPRLPRDVELVLLGAGAAAMRFFGHARVHVVLDYARDGLPALLAELAPDAALLPSTVAETYSYLLSELWSLRVPVIATALGSFAERIVDGRNGLLVTPDAPAVADLLERLRDDRSALDALRTNPAPSLRTLATMAADYRALLPAHATAAAEPSPERDGRGALAEVASRAQRERAEALAARLAAQQLELARRAEWAQAQEKLAQERTRWALASRAEATKLAERNEELAHEVEARGIWAQSLIVEAERLRELVASEQRRLEQELQAERVQFSTQRDRLEAELSLVLNSSSWRLTRPLRFLRRSAGSVATRLAFQLKRMIALRHRLLRSLRTRGLAGTVGRIRQEFRPPQPPAAYVLPTSEPDSLPVLVLSDAPRASVIVPVYNHFHHTRTCLAALAACGDATPFEVIVVDDGSTDETRSRLESLDGLRYHRNTENLGFIGACNAGAQLARGEHLVFLNNDTAVQPGWLDALLATFRDHADVGLAGAKLVYPDGRLQEAGGIVFSDASGWNYGRFEDPADPRFNFVREVDYCSGAAIAVPRALFERFGGFDPLYAPAYYEDTDLAMKVRAAGLRVLYQPASVVVHFEGVTSGTDTAGSGTKRFQVVNQQKFLARWREALAAHPAPGSDIVRARQHRTRREVLIIDATTPQPDHDSGSLRLVNTMRVLREEGCALTFFADNRAWVERYTAELQQLGVEVLWHPWLADPVQWFAANGRRFDLVFISRHYIASSYVGLVRLHAPQARLVFDTVDLHYLREQREAELAGSDELAHRADVTRSKELALIRSCDITLVVSPVEQELLRHEAPGARVEVLSNVHEVFGRRRGFSERRDLMFMGGYQHPPNVDAAMWCVQEILPRVRAQLPEVVFHLIGSKANDAVRALGRLEGVEFHGYVPDVEPFLDGCRLALAPLRYGAGVKGKVNMSMSYGQPVVATPIAVEGMHAEAGRDVLVAADAEGFAEAVVRAYRDEALWTSLSDHGLENVRRHFSFEAARAAVRRLFE
jgi:GT2 family glycosyltransferase/glycosyltransferase involved in cell wall biosynthesis